MPTLTLLPLAQSIQYRENRHHHPSRALIAIPGPDSLFVASRLFIALLAHFPLNWEIVVDNPTLPSDQIGVRFRLDPSLDSRSGFYQLDIADDLITIVGNAPESLWYGCCTLVQIIEQANSGVPQLSISDWADFPRRGVMLDISRDKVPKMSTLFTLIDLLASWKINEVQLYTEHTFAYRQHAEVWEKASPMTGAEILALDRFCRERYIDLVPNQNSFGHMHRWLMHDRYRPLAEVPEGLDMAIFLSPRPFSLAASDPGSFELIGGMYDELLPHFTSRYFNVGCDETFDLGKGRSKALVEARGKGQVYLDYLKQIAALVHGHGRIMQF